MIVTQQQYLSIGRRFFFKSLRARHLRRLKTPPITFRGCGIRWDLDLDAAARQHTQWDEGVSGPLVVAS